MYRPFYYFNTLWLMLTQAKTCARDKRMSVICPWYNLSDCPKKRSRVMCAGQLQGECLRHGVQEDWQENHKRRTSATTVHWVTCSNA